MSILSGHFRRILFASMAIAFFGCSEPTITAPVRSSTDDGSTEASVASKLPAPTELLASHGKKGIVQLKWKSVLGAARYKVFAAETPYSEYEQIGESATPFFEAEIAAGKNRYFKVAAINYAGTVSPYSNIAFGSTLASPVITAVTSNSEGTGATVEWWMENCNSSTYEDTVLYEIVAYAENRTTEVAHTNANGGELSATLTGLSPKTHYYFEVQVYAKSEQNNVLKSDMVDEETARKLIPNPAENFTAAQGISTAEIELKWNLPEFVDVIAGNNTYEQHALYFIIFRKEKSEDDSAFVQIKKYLHTEISEEYVPGAEATFTDTNAERGKQYDYRIQSFVADVPKTISSDSSVAEAEGWLVAIPSLKIVSDYVMNEENESKIDRISISFEVEFDDLGLSDFYTYILSEKFTSFDGLQTTEEMKLCTQSISSLNNYPAAFDFAETVEQGYYQYVLYIAENGTSDIPSEPYATAISTNSVTVTDDLTLLPKIENFEVKDGYADRFILSWDYDKNCTYTVSWIPYENNIPGDSAEVVLSGEDISVSEDGKASFSHEAVSGDVRQYTLKATSGLTDEKTFESLSKTLGTAAVSISEISYDKISVEWTSVQMAKDTEEDFEISLKYADSDVELVKLDSEENNLTITKNENLFSCEIDKPAGFDDAAISGKDMVLKVTAKSASVENEVSVAETTVRTLGPALVNCQISDTNINSNSISIRWNKVQMAKGYLIQRAKYNYNRLSGWQIASSDMYFYDADNSEISLMNGDLPEGCVSVVDSGSTLSLTDNYVESTEKYTYQVNQSQISWGIPFGYYVIPVLSKDDFVFQSNSMKLAEVSAVQYNPETDLSDVKGATFGYGLNIKAQKAISGKTQVIEWDAPYYESNIPTLYRKALGENSWEKINVVLAGGTKKAQYVPSGNDCYRAFDYLVKYESTSTAFAPSYLSKLEETKDEESETEQANKGYLLAVPFEAKYNGTDEVDENYYSEAVSWDRWNQRERALRPEAYTIYVKNLNLSSAWKPLATLDAAGDVKEIKTFDDTTISQIGMNLVLKPEGISKGTSQNTNGILKVLRDGKHYYKIELTRESFTSESESFAYRQITDEELVKCVNLIYASVLNNNRSSYQNDDGYTTNGNTGSFWVTKYTSRSITDWIGTDYLKWTVTNYNHIWTKDNIPGNEQVNSFLVLQDLESETKAYWNAQKGDGNKLRTVCYNSKDVSSSSVDAVDVSSPFNLASYSATVKFSYSDKAGYFYVVRNGETTFRKEFTENKEELQRWTPMAIGDTGTSQVKSSSYGWWEE